MRLISTLSEGICTDYLTKTLSVVVYTKPLSIGIKFLNGNFYRSYVICSSSNNLKFCPI